MIVTVSATPPPFSVGDFVEIDGEVYLVQSVRLISLKRPFWRSDWFWLAALLLFLAACVAVSVLTLPGGRP